MHAKNAISSAASSLRDVIDSAEDILEDVQNQKGRAADELRERLSGAVTNARAKLRELDLPDSVSEAYDDSVNYARANPWTTVAVGSVAVLAAVLLFRAISDD